MPCSMPSTVWQIVPSRDLVHDQCQIPPADDCRCLPRAKSLQHSIVSPQGYPTGLQPLSYEVSNPTMSVSSPKLERHVLTLPHQARELTNPPPTAESVAPRGQSCSCMDSICSESKCGAPGLFQSCSAIISAPFTVNPQQLHTQWTYHHRKIPRQHLCFCLSSNPRGYRAPRGKHHV